MEKSWTGWSIALAFLLMGSIQAADAPVPTTRPAGDIVESVFSNPERRLAGSQSHTSSKAATSRPASPAPGTVGGKPDGIVQVANLIYGGTRTSKCFSDHFLVQAEKESAISTSRRFHAVKLDSEELFAFPLAIMTGEGTFQLSPRERENLREYVRQGGFLLASAGCSSQEWDRSFRRELTLIFPKQALAEISMDHPVFHTVYDIATLQVHHGTPRPLEVMAVDGHLVVLYSREGLNDTAHTQGCCCCGGNEITNASDVNVNILAYALIY